MQIGCPETVAAADLNGDGKLDLVVGNNGGAGYMLGNGDGGFQQFQFLPQAPSTTGAFDSGDAVVADLNSNGYPDIITANITYQASVSVYLNNGDVLQPNMSNR